MPRVKNKDGSVRSLRELIKTNNFPGKWKYVATLLLMETHGNKRAGYALDLLFGFLPKPPQVIPAPPIPHDKLAAEATAAIKRLQDVEA